MNFKVLSGDIYFSDEFVKLNEIRAEFLQYAFDSTSIFTEECIKNFDSIEQLLKDGESFGYEYLNSYISKAIDIVNEFGVKEIDNDTFNKNYYLDNYCTWENTLEEIKNENNQENIDSNKINDITYAKLNINSELIKKPFRLKEKNIILDSDKIERGISLDIINKLVNAMIESIFNINFAVIDILNHYNIAQVESYNDAEDVNKSNNLIKELLENKIPQGEEENTIKEIIKLNPYNENIYKALLYKHGDKDNQLEILGEFLGYNNIHEYKHKLLDEYYRGLPNNNKEDINKAKENIVLFANKLGIKEYSEYVDKLNKMFADKVKLEDSIKTKEIEKNVEMATVEVTEKIRKDKKYDKIWISTGIIVGSLLAIYLIMTAYFNSHFFFRTYINGVNVTGKSNKSAQDFMAEKADNYVLTIKEREDNTEELNGKDINLKYDFTNGINELLENQNPFLWIKSIFVSNKYTVTEGISYDEELLKQFLGNLNCLDESNVKEPVSAYINYTGTEYEIIKEDNGNRIKYDEFYSKVLTHIQNVNDVLDLDKEKCYEDPKYTSEADVVVQAKNTVDKYISSKIIYTTSGDEIVIDSSLINTWINVDKDFNVTLNEDSIREYINELGDSYDNIGSTRTFTRWSGEVIKVSTTPGIYYVDRDSTVSEIVEAISNGAETTKELSFKTPSATDDYVINTFVEVDLSNQTIVYYKNGELITQGNVVTGDVSKGYSTPSGVYRLDWKAKDFVLRGDGYASPVSFWMPFNGGIGLHDASWRSSFGGSIYKTNGSHGCVNMPYSVAEAIYNNIEDKTTIICRY